MTEKICFLFLTINFILFFVPFVPLRLRSGQALCGSNPLAPAPCDQQKSRRRERNISSASPPCDQWKSRCSGRGDKRGCCLLNNSHPHLFKEPLLNLTIPHTPVPSGHPLLIEGMKSSPTPAGPVPKNAPATNGSPAVGEGRGYRDHLTNAIPPLSGMRQSTSSSAVVRALFSCFF